MYDEEDEEDLEIFTMEDENGAETDYALLGIVSIEEQHFAVLAPVEQLETEDPNLDLYAFHYQETDEGVDLQAVTDEALIEQIFTLAETELFGDDEDDEDWDWEDDEDEEDDGDLN